MPFGSDSRGKWLRAQPPEPDKPGVNPGYFSYLMVQSHLASLGLAFSLVKWDEKIIPTPQGGWEDWMSYCR